MVTVCRYTDRALLGDSLEFSKCLSDWIQLFLRFLLRFRLSTRVRGSHVEDVVANIELEVGTGVNRLRTRRSLFSFAK
jgi:hypothetical protein